MRERIKSALVDSFVGAIAVGWLFAEGVARFVTSFTTPLTEWIIEQMRYQQMPRFSRPIAFRPQFPFQIMIPQLIAGALLILIAYLLLRWLYFEPSEKQNSEQTQELEEGA
jgi:fructose-specific phosphotransferase system IIC component